MKLSLKVPCLVCSLAVAGCQAPAVDRATAARTLKERDEAWSSAAASGNLDSLLSYWTPDARVIMSGQPSYVGKDAIQQMVTASLAIPGFAISWKPDSAVVSASGDMGYTYGTNSITVPDSTGVPHTSTGRYVEVWRKDADGQWRCVIDFNNEGAS